MALHAAGIETLARSSKYHRPRGFFCLDGHCAACLLRIDGRPNQRACLTPARAELALRAPERLPQRRRRSAGRRRLAVPRGDGPPHDDDRQPHRQRPLPEAGARDGRRGDAARRARRGPPGAARRGARRLRDRRRTGGAGGGARDRRGGARRARRALRRAGGARRLAARRGGRHGAGGGDGRGGRAAPAPSSSRARRPSATTPRTRRRTAGAACWRSWPAIGCCACGRGATSTRRAATIRTCRSPTTIARGSISARACGRLAFHWGVRPVPPKGTVIILDGAPTAAPLERALARGRRRAPRASISRARRSSARAGTKRVRGLELRAADGATRKLDGELVAVATLPSPASELPRQHGAAVAFDAARGGFAAVVDAQGATTAPTSSPAATSPATPAPRRPRATARRSGARWPRRWRCSSRWRVPAERLRDADDAAPATASAPAAAPRPPVPPGGRRAAAVRRPAAGHAGQHGRRAHAAAPRDPRRRLDDGARQALRQDAGRPRLERRARQVRAAGARRAVRGRLLPRAQPDDRRARAVAHDDHRPRRRGRGGRRRDGEAGRRPADVPAEEPAGPAGGPIGDPGLTVRDHRGAPDDHAACAPARPPRGSASRPGSSSRRSAAARSRRRTTRRARSARSRSGSRCGAPPPCGWPDRPARA